MSDNNIWSDVWDPAEEDWSGGGVVSKRLPRAAENPGLGATVYELDPGDFVVYHFHHAWEELLVVLRGTPTLRTPEGERVLADGDVIVFPRGPEGAKGLVNESDTTARVLIVSTNADPDVTEYPDTGKVGHVVGGELRVHRSADAVDHAGPE